MTHVLDLLHFFIYDSSSTMDIVETQLNFEDGTKTS